MRVYHTFLLVAFFSFFIYGCANITAPTGGKKDIRGPKLIYISPSDSQRNARVCRLEMRFDEYITVGDVGSEVSISPTLQIDPVVSGLNKKVTVKIQDSLLEPYTTYRLSFGNAIKDVHEGNPFKNYTYTFSTGPYFDSLLLRGKIINAGTGLPESDGILVGLYDAEGSDSVVARHKPKYVVKAVAGEFVFKGLPERKFWIFAIKDVNNNMTYDGPAKGEMIAFNDSALIPSVDSLLRPVRLRIFAEAPDTSLKTELSGKRRSDLANAKSKDHKLVYTLNVDTSDASKKTFDLTKEVEIAFNDPFYFNKDKITLTYDSAGITVNPAIVLKDDSAHLRIATAWSPDKVYTLKLAKGFARDTLGEEYPPSRHIFRTWDEGNYGTITMHLPSKYRNSTGLYIFRVISGSDTVYHKPVTDTVFKITRLKPAQYSFSVVVDKNKNGKWDTGDLFNKIQPEEVIPYEGSLTLKAGWDNVIDFEQKKEEDKNSQRKKAKAK
jgi:hypothetical protein